MRIVAIVLAVALVASVAANVAVRRGTNTKPPLEYFPDMVRTPRYNAFEANPNFADGLTLRVPPSGTIARGMLPLSSEPGAGAENPFSSGDAQAAARGAVMFETYCVPCHGADGKGEGPIVKRGFPRPPDLIELGATLNDKDIFDAITAGIGTMPAYGAQIAREDRWKAILHLRTLQNGGAR